MRSEADTGSGPASPRPRDAEHAGVLCLPVLDLALCGAAEIPRPVRELAGKTGGRELNGLAEARRELKIGRGAILTYDQESAGSVEGETIRVVPVWKWLLGR